MAQYQMENNNSESDSDTETGDSVGVEAKTQTTKLRFLIISAIALGAVVVLLLLIVVPIAVLSSPTESGTTTTTAAAAAQSKRTQQCPVTNSLGLSCGTVGAVSTNHDLATKTGLAVLKRGGNAIDAAVAVQMMLGVVTPESTGIGGGCMVMVHLNTSETIFFDGREEAPRRFSEDAFCKTPACLNTFPFRPDSITGGHPVGVPGVLRVVERLLREHGTISFEEATRDAIGVARDGFVMSHHMYHFIEDNVARLRLFEGSKKLWLNEDGTEPAVAEGEILRNPDLANTLEKLATHPLGINWFYEGELAKEIVAVVAAAKSPWTNKSGLLEAGDLSGYRALTRRPLEVTFDARGDDKSEVVVLAPPPPTSGGMALLMQMSAFEALNAAHPRGEDEVKRLSDLINAQNIGFADRNEWVADTDWVDVPIASLLSKNYTTTRVRNLTANLKPRTMIPAPVPAGNPEGGRRNVLPRFVTRQPLCSTGGPLYQDLATPRGCSMAIKELWGIKRDAKVFRNTALPPGCFLDTTDVQSVWFNDHGAAGQSASGGLPQGSAINRVCVLSAYAGFETTNDENVGTAHFSVADQYGNVVSWTTTVERNFGSAITVPNRGFVLNNEMTDFDFTPFKKVDDVFYLRPNRAQGGKRPHRSTISDQNTKGGKRPRSSMTPAIVVRRSKSTKAIQSVYALGGAGGNSIFGAVLNVVLAQRDGKPLNDAIDAPRIISKNGKSALIEDALLPAKGDLEQLGFRFYDSWGRHSHGFVQGVASCLTQTQSQQEGKTQAVSCAAADTTRLGTAKAGAV